MLRQTQHLDRILLKRQDTVRILVIACTMLVALAVLVPMNAPATNPMQVITIVTTTGVPYQVNTIIFTFTFSNITTTTITTQYSTTNTNIYYTDVLSTRTVSTTNTTATTVTTTTYLTTSTLGMTTVPSTVLTTLSQTVTSVSTSYTTTGVTVISTSTYTKTGVTAPTPPPIPGFPLESILAGLGLGLLGVHLLYRNRREPAKNVQHRLLHCS
jgi:hypothetical protein